MNVALTRIIKNTIFYIFIDENSTKKIRARKIKMSASASRKIIGCIGKCTSGLTAEELDNITDHVRNTLSDCKGRKIFREFLSQSGREDDLACFNFHEKICRFIEDDMNNTNSPSQQNVETLTENINEALDIAADLYGVPEIDMALLERFSECLTTPRRDAMLDVLVDTKQRLTDHLANAHKDFRIYILQPCPKTKK